MTYTYWINEDEEDEEGWVGLEGITFEESDPTHYWVIMGHSGDWDYSHTWIVSVHTSDEEARSRVEAFDAEYQKRGIWSQTHRDIHFYSVEGPLSNASVMPFGTNSTLEDSWQEKLYAEEDESCEDVF